MFIRIDTLFLSQNRLADPLRQKEPIASESRATRRRNTHTHTHTHTQASAHRPQKGGHAVKTPRFLTIARCGTRVLLPLPPPTARSSHRRKLRELGDALFRWMALISDSSRPAPSSRLDSSASNPERRKRTISWNRIHLIEARRAHLFRLPFRGEAATTFAFPQN